MRLRAVVIINRCNIIFMWVNESRVIITYRNIASPMYNCFQEVCLTVLMLAFDWCVSDGVCSCILARRSSSSSTTTAWPATRAPSQRSTLDTRTRTAFSTSSTPRRKHSAPSDKVRQVLHRTWTSKLLMLNRGDIQCLDSSSYTEHGCLNIWEYGQNPSRTKNPKLTKPPK